MSENNKKSAYQESLKSGDTEEWVDLIFYRRIGYCWAILAKKLGVTPNAITIASIFLGVGAGVMFYFNNFWLNLIGVLLLVWADSFDSADGQLARMTGQYSRIGRILDGLSGDLWFLAIYVAICLRENDTSSFFMAHPALIWIIAVVTGMCHGTQAAMADYYRQLHLLFLKGESKSEADSSETLQNKYETLGWKSDFFRKLVLFFYIRYTRGQELRTPAMQRLKKILAERFPAEVPVSFRDAFRAKSLPLMKYTNILSFNVRSFALFAAILIFRMPWLYFAFELTVLNGVLIYMIVRHERMCRQLINQLEDGKY